MVLWARSYKEGEKGVVSERYIVRLKACVFAETLQLREKELLEPSKRTDYSEQESFFILGFIVTRAKQGAGFRNDNYARFMFTAKTI